MKSYSFDYAYICNIGKYKKLSHVICKCEYLLVLSIPPKVSVSDMMGILKGKLAIKLFKSYPKLKLKPYWGNRFWDQSYFVSTLGIDEEVIKRYVKYQEEDEKRMEEQQHRFDF